MKLAAIFIGFAWDAHAQWLRWRGVGNGTLAEWYEGRMVAYLTCARMCRDEAKTALAGRLER
ncbi:hypothetical protein UFOVP930_28 [uncultured Caudovirales phage]|uniref:Uncharacterized protein n=1 Tax=uncultured Caudovirales phage TaxID=2100421 RepID=A0A6J7XM81_9CAUD|nr:hypothetical protein UFOVP930_28 [uncultured Caudovirales phage]CAB4200396.1 hypothetical protein UFOVP1354_38 [uncultured Caudovirales phage]CAB5238429.1 hypothetical protein UFOVP1547_17 [uncultured Caudovirales phage]